MFQFCLTRKCMVGQLVVCLFGFFLPTSLFPYLIYIYKTTTSFVISPFFPLDVFHWWLYVVELFFTFVLITPIVLLVFKKNLKRCIRDYCMPLVIKLCVIPIFCTHLSSYVTRPGNSIQFHTYLVNSKNSRYCGELTFVAPVC